MPPSGSKKVTSTPSDKKSTKSPASNIYKPPKIPIYKKPMSSSAAIRENQSEEVQVKDDSRQSTETKKQVKFGAEESNSEEDEDDEQRNPGGNQEEIESKYSDDKPGDQNDDRTEKIENEVSKKESPRPTQESM